jgi:hypothetical protein
MSRDLMSPVNTRSGSHVAIAEHLTRYTRNSQVRSGILNRGVQEFAYMGSSLIAL